MVNRESNEETCCAKKEMKRNKAGKTLKIIDECKLHGDWTYHTGFTGPCK